MTEGADAKLVLVQIDLSQAELALLDAYEAEVLPLLGNYGARLEDRLRAEDGNSEVHLLYFPDDQALDAFRDDPSRVALQDMWRRSGAVSTLTRVVRLA